MTITAVDHENQAVGLFVVVLPVGSKRLLAADVPDVENAPKGEIREKIS